MRGAAIPGLIGLLCSLGACDAAEDVEVQPLPPLTRPSPEARLGLPEVAGTWRFAGWELAPDDSASLDADLPALGEILLQTQRLDSVAGYYLAGGARLPVVGEVRRDGVVSLVAFAGSGNGRYVAGRVSRDTLWIGLTSLVDAAVWPADARVAYVRTPVAAPFVRLEGAVPALAVADSAVGLPPSDSALIAAARSARDTSRAVTPAAPPPQRARPQPATPVRPTPTQPRRTPPVQPPADTQRTPPVREPEPADSVRQPPPPVQLLGVPVRPPRDTARDTTSVR